MPEVAPLHGNHEDKSWNSSRSLGWLAKQMMQLMVWVQDCQMELVKVLCC